MSQKKNIDVLTSLRGIAALLIVVHHMGLLMLPLRQTVLGGPLSKFGLLGMSTFFVLSGFVIHYNYAQSIRDRREQGVLAFLFARFARLYPLYFLFILSNYALNTARAPDIATANTYAATFPVYIAGMQSWWYSIINKVNISVAQEYANNSWSISTEVFLYLLYIPFALKSNLRGSVKAALGLCAIAALGRIVFVGLANSPEVDVMFRSRWGASPSMPISFWLTYISPYGRVWEFLAGVGVAEVWLALDRWPITQKEKRITAMLAIPAFAYLVLSLFDPLVLPRLFAGKAINIGYSLAIPVMLFVLCRFETRMERWLCSAALLFAGEISFSLYLLHGDLWPLFQVKPAAEMTTAVMLEMAGWSVAFLVVLFVLSWAVYRYIEMPARRRIMDFYRKSAIHPHKV